MSRNDGSSSLGVPDRLSDSLARRALPLHEGAAAYGRVLAQAGGLAVAPSARLAGTAGLYVGAYSSPPYDLHVPALPVSRLSINLTAARVVGGLEGERPRHYGAPRHSLFLMPAGASAHWRKDVPSRHLNVYFDPRGFDTEPPCDGWRDLPHTPLWLTSLPGVRALADALAVELASSDAFSAEAVESLARLLLIRLARHRRPERGSADRLSPAMLRRLQDYVEAHLAERVLVTDMAAVVGMSPGRFAHAYSTQTGQPPHQFVIAQRLRRAVNLLQCSSLGLAEIAAHCGFASQQHMTHTMRRRLGLTPGRCRTVRG